MKRNSSAKFPYQIVIVDILIFVLMIACTAFGNLFLFLTKQNNVGEATTFALYIPLFVLIIAVMGFYLFVEYKFNRLKFNKILIAFGIVIAVSNLISVLSLPSHLVLPNNQTYDISTIERIYCVLWGFVLAILPYLFTVLFPRRVNSRGYVNLILKGLIGFSLILILTSFIFDREVYAHLFQGGEYEGGIKSFLGHRNSFGYVMLLTIMATISLHIRKKNWKWSLYLIPLTIFLLLSNSKICIFLGLLIILIHLIIRIVILAKKNRDNLIITLSISSLFLLLVAYLSTMMALSTSGVLFEIKSIIIKAFDNAGNTLASRSAIWECSFKILNTQWWSYIFGFGGLIFPNALCLVYASNPGISEPNIYWAHNGVVELLCQGGIILLLIYALLYVYLIYITIKLSKKQPLFAGMGLLFIFAFIVRSMFESSFLFGKDMDIVATLIIAIPLINEYHLVYQNEQELRNELVNQSKKIKNTNFKSKTLTFNKKVLLLEAKYIAYDLNNKIRL